LTQEITNKTAENRQQPVAWHLDARGDLSPLANLSRSQHKEEPEGSDISAAPTRVSTGIDRRDGRDCGYSATRCFGRIRPAATRPQLFITRRTAADPEEDRSPFTFFNEDGALQGVNDDKGPALFIMTAVSYMREPKHKHQFIWELKEEIGSQTSYL
jgi:hypothetical protein